MANDQPQRRSQDGHVSPSPSTSKSSIHEIEVKATSDDSTIDGLPTFSGTNRPDAAPMKLRADDIVEKLSQALGQENISHRQLGVVFSQLSVTGVGRTSIIQPTVLHPHNYSELLNDYLRPPVRDILSGFTGVVKPGEMLLVLGRPNAGCTTLLKTLSNDHGEFHSVGGDLSFDGFTSKELDKHYRGDVLYCGEEDRHFSTLTVQETLGLSATLRAPANTAGLSLDAYADLAVDYLTESLGLGHAKKTLVGDASIRGISGGEKRRTSVAELLASRPCIGCWDNVTRGLDASNAIELIHLMRVITQAFKLTTAVSLYQAGDALYDQFDKVCLLYEGKMAYFGPANQARQYFIDMGYAPAPRQTMPDFLLSVTDPKARLPKPNLKDLPSTADEFADTFRTSPLGMDNEAQVTEYRNQLARDPERKHTFSQNALSESRSRFGARTSRSAVIAPLLLQLFVLMRRQVQRIKGNLSAVVLGAVFFALQAIIMGTVFLNMPETTSAFFSRGGVLFFALFFATLMAFTEIPLLYVQRPIVAKHKKAALYHPSIEALSYTLIDLPLNFVTMILFCIILYFLSGLQRTGGQFFIFFVFVFLVGVVMKIWFRFLAAAFQSKDAASSLAGVTLLVTSLYTGYYIPRDLMVRALHWLAYVNPFLYGFEALTSNEFRTLEGLCTSLVPQGPGYENVTLANQVCTIVGATSGQPTVRGRDYLELAYSFMFSNTWRNLGIILAFAFGTLAGLLLVSQINNRSNHELTVTRFVPPPTYRRLLRGKPKDDEEKVLATAEKSMEVGIESSAIPAQHTFSFQHVSYSVPVPGGKEKKLLDDISGYVGPGRLTALMGESGAGKTTLLNLLARRHATGTIEGSQQIGGAPLPIDFPRQIGYCEQIDTHLETATVREALLFSAQMRQPYLVSKAEKEEHVDRCLQLCELKNFENTVLGSLNLELRKRVSIAVELAAKPAYLLFLDEPTSGLDSQSAWAIVSLLRRLANSGQAIICTIHQPSAELFQAFDKVLLLQKGGKTAYFGDIGQDSRKVIKYFERYNLQSCGSKENPAEYMFASLRSPPSTLDATSDWASTWRDSPENSLLCDELARPASTSAGVSASSGKSQYATPWFYQVSQLILRTARHYWRDPNYVWAKLIMNGAGGLLIGFSFFQAGNSQQDTQNKLFATFMTLMICGPACLQLQSLFISMRTLYQLRERPNQMYAWSALITSQLLVETPWNMFSSFVFLMCWYWPIGLPTSRAGYTILLYCVVLPLYYTSLAQAAAAMSSSVEIAGLVFTLFYSFVLIFNGVLQPFALLGWWKWMYHISPFTYVVEGLLGQAIGRQPIVCSELELAVVQPPEGQTCTQYMSTYINNTGGYLVNPEAMQNCQFCATSSTDQFLSRSFNIQYSDRWIDLGVIMAFVALNVVAIYGFTFLRYQRFALPAAWRRRHGRVQS